MKRMFAIALVALFAFLSISLAESIDFASMTDEELRAIIDTATTELATRQADGAIAKEKDALIYSDNGLTVRFLGWSYSDGLKGDNPYITIEMSFENNSKEKYSLMWPFGKSYVNNWEATVMGSDIVEATRNSVEGICLQNLSKIGITSIEDIKDVEIEFRVKSESNDFMIEAAFPDIQSYPMYEK